MSQFKFISKRTILLCNHDQDVDLHDSYLVSKDCVDFLLHRDNSKLHIIISKEEMTMSAYFDVYVYDGNFLKNWLDNELNFTKRKSTLIKYNDDNNDDPEISMMCQCRTL